MYVVSKNPGAFGANDKLACKQCDGMMLLSRRSPHPILGVKVEEQRFTCTKCGHEATRSVDEQGRPMAET